MNETHFFWGHCRVSTGCHCSSAVKVVKEVKKEVKVECHFSSMGFSLQRTVRKSHRGEISWIINFMYQPIAVLCCAYNCASRIDLTDMRRHLDSTEENQKDQEKTVMAEKQLCYSTLWWSTIPILINLWWNTGLIYWCTCLSSICVFIYLLVQTTNKSNNCRATAQGWQRSIWRIPSRNILCWKVEDELGSVTAWDKKLLWRLAAGTSVFLGML